MTSGVGRVVAFDAQGGYGAVVGDDGAEHVFHLTSIAGGSRAIEVGTVVAYELVAGHLGRWEAAGLRPLPA